jgi:hypothetical protein
MRRTGTDSGFVMDGELRNQTRQALEPERRMRALEKNFHTHRERPACDSTSVGVAMRTDAGTTRMRMRKGRRRRRG